MNEERDDQLPKSAHQSSMVIQEESKWINTQMPDFDDSQQNRTQPSHKSHKREVKSFDI